MEINNVEAFVEASKKARVVVHDANNALFVAKGFVEEIGFVIKDEEYLKPGFNKEELVSMLNKVVANMDKIGTHLKQLGKFAREDVFDSLGVKNPDSENAKNTHF
jgi:hypothetical protein